MEGGRSYPVTSRLGDIFTNFLGRKTQRTNLGRQGGRGTDLTSGGTEVAVFPSRQLRLAHRSQVRSRGQIAVVMVSAKGSRFAYMTFTSLGSNLGAVHRVVVSTMSVV